MEKPSTVSWCRKFKASISRNTRLFKVRKKTQNNRVVERTRLSKIIRLTKLFAEGI
jgi:hypothetical protein